MTRSLAHRTGPRRRAFTLIETIMAIVILSLAVPAMLWAMKDAVSKRVDPVLADQARWLAVEKIETIMSDRHSTSRGYAYVVNANYAAENPVSGFTKFSRSVNIVETAADLTSAGTGYKKVTVTVSYTDGQNAARSFALDTVLTEYVP